MVRIVIPFKDQKSAAKLRSSLRTLSQMVVRKIQPIFKSCKLQQILSNKEKKPTQLSSANVVYQFRCPCSLGASYIGYTTQYLFQRIDQHGNSKSSAIYRHLAQCGTPISYDHFSIIARLQYRYDCLIRECIEISTRKPSLNTQSDSLKSILY